MADMVQRTINKSDSTSSEDDVSKWLLGIADIDGPETLKETRSLRSEDTRTTMNRVTLAENSTVEDVTKLAQAAAAEDEADAESNGEPVTDDEPKEEGSGVWKWLKRGKPGTAKKEPGKLPPRADQGPTKDSRAAAADILREMRRRRLASCSLSFAEPAKYDAFRHRRSHWPRRLNLQARYYADFLL